MEPEFLECGWCVLAETETLPDVILRERITAAEKGYLSPKAKLLQNVRRGQNTLVKRRCSLGGCAFGSSLCGREKEFEPKTQ